MISVKDLNEKRISELNRDFFKRIKSKDIKQMKLSNKERHIFVTEAEQLSEDTRDIFEKNVSEAKKEEFKTKQNKINARNKKIKESFENYSYFS